LSLFLFFLGKMYKFAVLSAVVLFGCVLAAEKYIPPKLPCELYVEFEDDCYTMNQQGDYDRSMTDHEIFINGNYFKFSQEQKLPFKSYQERVVRPDLNISEPGQEFKFRLFEGSLQQGLVCNKEYITQSQVDQMKETYMFMFAERTFDSKGKGVFHGEEYTVYSVAFHNDGKDADDDVKYYVDDDGFVVGYVLSRSMQQYGGRVVYNQSCIITYDDQVKLEHFVLQERFKQCPSEAYVPPTYSTCSASTHLAALALVAASMVLALVSLF